jgi:hypothetical protein
MGMSTYQKSIAVAAALAVAIGVQWGLYAFGGAGILPADLSGYDKVVEGTCFVVLLLAMWLFQPSEGKYLMATSGAMMTVCPVKAPGLPSPIYLIRSASRNGS